MDALGIGTKSKCTEDWEAQAWRSLQNAVHVLKSRVDIIAQAYTQAVSVQESMTSNKQARQVGYLTSLATLFIPVSLIAGIFSMGGKFSAGASLFWVYWAISIPIVIAGCILLFTRLGGRALGHAPRNGSFV
jgi:Mg2+ and Co2+ transporter CorA